MAGGVAIVVIAVAAWLVLRPDTYVVPSGDPDDVTTLQPRPAQASQALAELVHAIDRRDPRAAAELAPAGDPTTTALLADVVANAGSLDVTDLGARYVDETGPVTPGGTWTAAVDLTWAFRGFDSHPAHEEVQVAFAIEGKGDDSRVAIDALGGGRLRAPLWLLGPLQVRRTTSTLVLTTGDAAQADDIAKRAVAAVPVVHRVLPGWRARLVLEVPDSEDQLDEVLDEPSGTYDNIAAVTSTVDGSTTPGAPIHVFVNPAVLGGLQAQGAQIVISHEATHVATRAPLASMPVWLVEGFADYVALRDVKLPLATTAGQILAQVRNAGPPAALPDSSDFAGTNDALGAVYEAAWLACRVLADRVGQAGLVDLYERTDHGQDLDTALHGVTGLSTRQFTRLWRQRLTSLAAA